MTLLTESERENPFEDYGRHGNVLVLNSGSSSLKYQLVDPSGGDPLADGIIERIGQQNATLKHTAGGTTTKREHPVLNHGEALRIALGLFEEFGPDLTESDVFAVGHRVVHGGAVFSAPTVIDDHVVEQIEALSPLAPLHNPANLTGIKVARELFADVPHVAVFDTAFFADLPDDAATYGVNAEVAREHGVRRYGFHGTSHQYVSTEAAHLLGRAPQELNTIVLHLGNGASASAVRQGRAVDTSMGLTPLEGLVMGTRSGDVDPGVVFHLHRNAGMSIDEIDELLNKRSGVKGFAGVSDFRELQALIRSGSADAALAMDVYVHRIKKYIGGYLAVLGRVDVIAFTAGIGENDAKVRESVLSGLESLGIVVDKVANDGCHGVPAVISTPESKVRVLVVPTAEELAIARQCVEVVAV